MCLTFTVLQLSCDAQAPFLFLQEGAFLEKRVYLILEKNMLVMQFFDCNSGKEGKG